jgi:hypothetical protein
LNTCLLALLERERSGSGLPRERDQQITVFIPHSGSSEILPCHARKRWWLEREKSTGIKSGVRTAIVLCLCTCNLAGVEEGQGRLRIGTVDDSSTVVFTDTTVPRSTRQSCNNSSLISIIKKESENIRRTASTYGYCVLCDRYEYYQSTLVVYRSNQRCCCVVLVTWPGEILVPFGCADKPAEKYCSLICCEKKILFQLKKTS